MTIKLRLDSFFNGIQIGVRNSVLPTVHFYRNLPVRVLNPNKNVRKFAQKPQIETVAPEPMRCL
jgi:hypothetical protein